MSSVLKVLKPSFIIVQIQGDDKSEKNLELENDKLPLANLQFAFPGAQRLLFFRDGKLRMLTPTRRNDFDPPRDGWDTRKYYVEKHKVKPVKDDIQQKYSKHIIPPGEEEWDILVPWDNLQPNMKTIDFMTKRVDPEVIPISTTLLTEPHKITLNENFDQLYGAYDKLWDEDPIKSMFSRMDAALERRRKKLEEEKQQQASDKSGSNNSKESSKSRHRSRSSSRHRGSRRSRSRDRSSRRSRSRGRDSRRSRSHDRSGGRSRSDRGSDRKVQIFSDSGSHESADIQIVLEKDSSNKVEEVVDLSSSDDEMKVKEERYRKREERRLDEYDRRRRYLEEEESRTRKAREYYHSERRKLREERIRMENMLKEQEDRERWIRKSDDFLNKLGIRTDLPSFQQQNHYDERGGGFHKRDDPTHSRQERSVSPYSSSYNSYNRSRSPERPEFGSMSRYSKSLLDQEHSLQDGRSGSRHMSREESPLHHNPGSSRYSPTDALVERTAPADIDFRKTGGELERRDMPGSAGRNLRSLSPEIEEVQFGRPMHSAPREVSDTKTSQASVPALGVLKPGSYLTITFDIVCLGTGLSTELYQIGAYSSHGESFVKCLQPTNLMEEAERHLDLPLVMFKNSYHVNNRQTGQMEPCVLAIEALRAFMNFIKDSLNRTRPACDGVVLVCESNMMMSVLLEQIKSHSLNGHFWSRVASMGSLEHLVRNHPNSSVFLSSKDINLDEMYYQLFKQLIPFSKYFSDQKSKHCYEVLVKILDRNPSFLNYFKDYTFPRNSREMQRIMNPTFFLNRWETFAPLRLFIMRALKSEREGMLEEDMRFLPQVSDIAKKMCRNLIDAGFIFEELLEMAKTRGLSETELQLRTVLLQRMAGQSRNVIDTAIQSTKLVVSFFVQNGHKNLEEMLEDVRTSKELSAEYMKPVLQEPVPGQDAGPSSSSSSKNKGIPSLMDIEIAGPSGETKQHDNGQTKGKAFAEINPKDLEENDEREFSVFRRYIVNKVMINASGQPMKRSEIQRFINVLLKCGIKISDIVEANKSPQTMNDMTQRLKPLFNRIGPYNVGFETYKSWLKEFIDRHGLELETARQNDHMKKNAKAMMTGIPRSMY